MAIRLEDELPAGRVIPADADYPDGSYKDEAIPEVSNDGSPITADVKNSKEGFFQALLIAAGITPSGVPDTVLASDYKDALDTLFSIQAQTTHNMASDADYTLTASQAQKAIIEITDTGPVLTGAVNIIVPDDARVWIVDNSTAQILTFKTLAGSGVAIAAGVKTTVYSNGTNVVEEAPESGSWNPVYTSSIGSLTTVTTTNATYQKVGNRYHINLIFTLTDIGTGAGRIDITGLPAAPANTGAGTGANDSAGFALWVTHTAAQDIRVLKYDASTAIINGNILSLYVSFEA